MENIELRKVLLKLGISANIKGFNYIIQAVNFIDEQKIHTSMLTVYNELAEINNTTPSAIERAIRFAIMRSHKNNDIMKKIYKNKVYNSQFIYDLVYNFDIFTDAVE